MNTRFTPEPSDMRAAIIPKSDQLNADDLIAGPMTIKVSEVTIRGGQEQPVSIHFEGDGGKPYKPCKSMSRVLVAAWGPDAKVYAGRSMTLYRDPSVKWGGMDVGGIRISHLSHIGEQMTMALTATKGSRKAYTVRVLEGGDEIDWRALINNAASLAELQKVWRSKALPANLRTELEPAKDARKAALEAAAAGTTAPAVTFATVAAAINAAADLPSLDAAAAQIGQVPNIDQQVELKELADSRRAALTAPE